MVLLRTLRPKLIPLRLNCVGGIDPTGPVNKIFERFGGAGKSYMGGKITPIYFAAPRTLKSPKRQNKKQKKDWMPDLVFGFVSVFGVAHWGNIFTIFSYWVQVCSKPLPNLPEDHGHRVPGHDLIVRYSKNRYGRTK